MANDGTVRIGVEFEAERNPLKKVNQAISELEKESEKLNDELEMINRNLTRSGQDAEFVAQKQSKLSEVIAETSEKLRILEDAQEDVTRAFNSGDIPLGEYEAFQRELNSTRADLLGYRRELEALDNSVPDINVDTNDLSDNLRNAGNNSDRLKNSLEVLGKVAGTALKVNFEIASKSMQGMATVAGTSLKVAGGAAAAGVGAVATGVGGLLAYGNQYNSEMETLRTSFEVMTGSAEKAGQTLERLKELGAATPYETKDLAETTQLLMNYGLSADKAVDVMMMLGDAAQGDAEKLYGIAMAYGQMSSAGKVSLEDIKQMIERGFNPLQEISESTGESMASLYDRITKGTISIDEITASIMRSSSEGGKYFQSMIKQSQTAAGQISTLQDNFAALTGMMAADTSTAITADLLPQANSILEILGKTFETSGWQGLSKAFGFQLRNALTTALESAPELLDMGEMLIQNIYDGFMGDTDKLEEAVAAVIARLPMLVSELFSMSFDVGGLLSETLLNSITANSNRIAQSARVIVQSMVEFFSTQSPLLSEAATALLRSIGGELDANGDKLLEDIGGVLKLIPEFISKNLPTLLGGATGFVDIILQFLGGVWEAAATLLTDNKDLFSAAVGDVITSLSGFLENGVDDVLDIILALVDIIADNVGLVADAALKIGIAIVDALADPKVAKSLVDAGFSILDGIVNALDGNLDTLIESSAKMIETIVSTLLTGDNLAKIIKATEDIITTLTGAIGDSFPELYSAAGKIISTITVALLDPQILDQLGASAISIITALCEELLTTENLQSLISVGMRATGEIITGLADAILSQENESKVMNELGELAQKIFDFFANKDWMALGAGILSGIWAGLKGESFDFQSVLADWMGTDSGTVSNTLDDLTKPASKEEYEDFEGGTMRRESMAEKIARLRRENSLLPDIATVDAFRSGNSSMMAANTPVSSNGAWGSVAYAPPVPVVNNMNITVEPGADMSEYEVEQAAVKIADQTGIFNFGR